MKFFTRHAYRNANGQTHRPVAVRSMPRKPKSCKLLLEALEDRTVPALGLASALSVGHGTGSSAAVDVATDAAGYSYMTGAFRGTTDFDPANVHAGDTDIITARGLQDGFVAKYAPDNSLVWVRRMGGDATSSGEFGNSLTVDSSGNIYVTGQFYDSADFGVQILVSSGERDGFVTKLNSSGTFLWANRWGTAVPDLGTGIGVDSNGNVYVTGMGGTTCNFLKFKSNGALDWTKSINNGNATDTNLEVDSSGNLFVGGLFHGTMDFDPSNKTAYASSGPSTGGFVLKLTNKGNFSWVRPFSGIWGGSPTAMCFLQEIMLDGNGNVLVGGSYHGQVDFNPGAGTTILPGSEGGFITKLNSSGNFVWAKALEGDTQVLGLTVDATGSIYASGHLNGTADFDPGAGTASRTTAGGPDAFVMKLDAGGNFAWAETFGSTGDDYAHGVAVDPSGTVHLAGRYQGTIDFDPDPTDHYFLTNPGPYNNLFLVRLTQS